MALIGLTAAGLIVVVKTWLKMTTRKTVAKCAEATPCKTSRLCIVSSCLQARILSFALGRWALGIEIPEHLI